MKLFYRSLPTRGFHEGGYYSIEGLPDKTLFCGRFDSEYCTAGLLYLGKWCRYIADTRVKLMILDCW